jgi:hypothetical protein
MSRDELEAPPFSKASSTFSTPADELASHQLLWVKASLERTRFSSSP